MVLSHQLRAGSAAADHNLHPLVRANATRPRARERAQRGLRAQAERSTFTAS